jgi:hypothetical protein
VTEHLWELVAVVGGAATVVVGALRPLLTRWRSAPGGPLPDDAQALAKWATFLIARPIGHRARRRLVLQVYLHALMKRNAFLRLPSLGSMPLDIDTSYVPLELRASSSLSVNELLAHDGLVQVQGDPGSGKSALMSVLIRECCQRALAEPAAAPLPVDASLKHIMASLPDAGVTPEGAMSALESWFLDACIRPLDRLPRSDDGAGLLRGPTGLAVFLDGLDELDADDLVRAESFVLSLTEYLSHRGPASVVVLATRRQALEFAKFDEGRADVVRVDLAALSPAGIYAYLASYRYPAHMHPADEADRIFAQLNANATLLETCANPLALAWYVERDIRFRGSGQSSVGLAPETRATFYKDIVEYLLVNRRAEQQATPGRSRMVLTTRVGFFATAVRDHIQAREPINRISHSIMLGAIRGLVREGTTADEALNVMAKDTGIFHRLDDDTWAFIHISYLHYFHGCVLAEKGSANAVQTMMARLRKERERYIEGFYFAVGLMGSRSSHFLQEVLAAVGQSTHLFRLYPRAALEAQAFDLPEFLPMMRDACRLWREETRRSGGTDEPDVLLSDIVAVLTDYEIGCAQIGRTPEITLEAEVLPFLSEERKLAVGSVELQLGPVWAQAAGFDAVDALRTVPVPQALVALYQPRMLDMLAPAQAMACPRVAALVSEAALQSSMVSRRLGRGAPPSALSVRRRLRPVRGGWAASWSIRGTPLAAFLAVGLEFVAEDPARAREFPQLRLLSLTQAAPRLVAEILAIPRMRFVIVGGTVAAFAAAAALSGSLLTAALAAASALTLVLALLRLLSVRGQVRVPSVRILSTGFSLSERRHGSPCPLVLVRGDRHTLRPVKMRRPRRTEAGAVYCLYHKANPLYWRRFAPALGDRRLSLVASATAKDRLGTDELRRLLSVNA